MNQVSTQPKKPQTILIVGGDSSIGSALYREAKARGLNIFRTSRRGSNSENTWQLSLGDETSVSALIKSTQVHGVTDAVVAVGQTSIAFCAKNKYETYKTNVTDTLELIAALVNIGVNVIVLSSSAVFSGRSQRPSEDSSCDPETEYGHQKVDLEKSVLQLEGPSILRLTKVLIPTTGLWSQWIEAIQKGGRIQAFGNVNLAPLRISVVVDIILRCLARPISRIVHVSPPDELTYSEAVILMAEELHSPLNMECVDAARDVDRGISPDRWVSLGRVPCDAFSEPESAETAMRVFTREVLGLHL